MPVLLYTLAVLALIAGLTVFCYLDRVYRELGRVSTGRLHANLDVFEAEIEPRFCMDRRGAALTSSQRFASRLKGNAAPRRSIPKRGSISASKTSRLAWGRPGVPRPSS